MYLYFPAHLVLVTLTPLDTVEVAVAKDAEDMV
jgi:hypothetical protein